MKVAYILKTWPRLSQTFIVNEILAHEAAGLAIEIYALRRPKAEDALADVTQVKAPVTYLCEPGEVPDSGVAIDRLCRALQQRRSGPHGIGSVAPITHLHAHFGNSAAEAARRAAEACGLPWSFTAHARDIYLDSVDQGALSRRIAAADHVVTVSDFNLAHLRASFASDARKIVRIYNGLDLQRLDRPGTQRREPLILGVGRLVEKKGFADLIAACARLDRSAASPWRCVIAGGGPLEATLREQIAALGLGDRVDLLGACTPAQVVALMRRAAVLAAPCIVSPDGDRDGLPTVLLEAMALGCTCVATAVTGIPELVIDGQTGRLLPQHDPAALAGALTDLLADGAERARLAQAGRALVEQHFDIRRTTARMRALFLDRQTGWPARQRGDRSAAQA